MTDNRKSLVKKIGSSRTAAYEVISTFTRDGFASGLYRVEYEQFKGYLARNSNDGKVKAEVRVYEHSLTGNYGEESFHDFLLRGHFVQSDSCVRTHKKITSLKDPSALEFMLNTDLLPQEVRKIIRDGQLAPELS